MLNLIQGDITVNKDLINLINTPVQVQQEEKKEPTYTVIEGDNLSKIAEKYKTTWQRLWNKNTNLTNQDQIDVGTILKIPASDEVLAERPLYVLPRQTNAVRTPQNGSNGYEPGQCVWYVKNRRPDIPNNWGNATSWLGNAQAQGWPTGSKPVAGAIGWTSGHVVYIESVNADGTVNYSDMNGRWIAFEIGSGTKPANYYTYIY